MYQANWTRLLQALLIAEVFFVIYSVVYLKWNGRLPPPFIYDSVDTFMDYFNTNYWARQEGRFEEWRSIYPIIVFAFAQLFRSSTCDSVAGSVELRNCDSQSIYYVFIIYGLAVLICAFKLLGVKSRRPPLLWAWLGLSLVLLLSLPGLYALERGNYIVLALFFLASAVVLPPDWRSALFLALAINIKQYLLVLLLVHFLKGRHAYIALTLAFVLLINILGLVLVQEAHYAMLIENMLGFSGGELNNHFEKIWNSTSLTAWDRAIRLSHHPLNYLSFTQLDLLKQLATLTLFLLRFISLSVVGLLIWRRNELSSDFIALALMFCLMANTDSLGGYATILCFPFLAAVNDSRQAKIYAFLIFLLYFPLEFPVGPGIPDIGPSFLGVIDGEVFLRITIGAMLRPIFVSILVAVLFFDLLKPSLTMKHSNHPA